MLDPPPQLLSSLGADALSLGAESSLSIAEVACYLIVQSAALLPEDVGYNTLAELRHPLPMLSTQLQGKQGRSLLLQ